MTNGIMSVLIVFLLLAVGAFFTWKKRWPENTNKVFSIVVVQIAAPALAIVNIENGFTRDLLKESGIYILLIAVSLALMFLLSKLLAKVLKLPKKKSIVFQTTFTFNNTMFIGLPVIRIIFGEEGLPYLFAFYLVTIVLFWSLGAYVLCRASEKVDAAFSLKKVFSPGLIGVCIGGVLVAGGWQLPYILETALTYLSNLCVPLSLLVIGSNLAKSFRRGFSRITLDQIVILAGKFVIHPLLIWCLFSAVGVTGLPLRVFVLAAALPCHAQNAIMAEYYELEGEYASNLVSLSTLVSLITIPLYAKILLG